MSQPAEIDSNDSGLHLHDVSGGYGDTLVVRAISIGVQPGQVLGIIGRNGVGKSTLLKLIVSQLPLAGGSMQWRGQWLGQQGAHRNRSLGISYAPQEALVFDTLSVAENINLHGKDLSSCRALLASFPIVQTRLALPAGVLSGGEKKLVSFVRVLSEGSALTLLDEPTEGVQQENIDRMAQHIQARSQAGDSFIIAEQNLNFLMPIMHQVLVLDHGASVFCGSQFERTGLEVYLRV